jgi:septal ring factor EnvC (AmiA/AmiB activator)
MNIKDAQKKIDQLSEAFDRQELQLEQTQKMLDQYKRQLSELESVIIKARNALTPRGLVKLSSEQENGIQTNTES